MSVFKIIGIKNNSYVKKDTGEYIGALELHLQKAPKKTDTTAFGVLVSRETIMEKNFPEEFKQLMSDLPKSIGRSVSISKDTKTFRDSTYSFIDEFELL